MKQNWKATTCLLVVMTLTTLLIINGQKQAKDEDQPDVTQFPMVETLLLTDLAVALADSSLTPSK